MKKRTLQLILTAGPVLSGLYVWGMFEMGVLTSEMLIWPALCLHQFEEYVATERLLGERYFLLNWLFEAGYDLTPHQVFVMDVGVGWTGAIAVGWLPGDFQIAAIFLILFFAWNGVWHLSLTSHFRSFSPGSLTGLVLYLPLAYVVATEAVEADLLEAWSVGALSVGALIAHHVFLGRFPRSPHHHLQE